MTINGLLNMFWGKIKQTDKERSEAIKELHKALEEVKILSGFLPICASCKKIRPVRPDLSSTGRSIRIYWKNMT